MARADGDDMKGGDDMTLPSAEDLYRVSEATWPPAAHLSQGPWTLRDGRGGGKRVCAATGERPATPDDVADAETAMRGLGQTPIFMIRDGQDDLDMMLQDAGYRIIDPVNIYVCETDRLSTIARPRVSGFAVWPPLRVMTDIWAAGGIGLQRIDVMDRAQAPKSGFLARKNDRAAGVAFVAVHDQIAMLHALEVPKEQRRQGVARTLMGHAGHWAAGQGAKYFSLLVTRQNIAANALYASLGMEIAGHYHYRIR